MQVLELAALHPANAKAVDRATTYLVQSVIAGVVAGMASVRNGSKADIRAYAVSLSAAIAATIARIRRRRMVVVGSSKKAMPTITVPTAPIPPHTA